MEEQKTCSNHPVRTSREAPMALPDRCYTHPSFFEKDPLPGKRPVPLPAMGWNSWNAFGSGNTEALTKEMADKIVSLGLDTLGYRYVVLDDGCYCPTRVDGRLASNPDKFPSGFQALGEYIHAKGLLFGMYNDIGTATCAGDQVGICGSEDLDAQSYIEWGVDFLKVDNCYYPWDNASFSRPDNAQYSFAPNIRAITLKGPNGYRETFNSAMEGTLTGRGGFRNISGDYITRIGTIDGTNIAADPNGSHASELVFHITVPEGGDYTMVVCYATGEEAGVGRWLQVAVGEAGVETRFFDGLLPATPSPRDFVDSQEIPVTLTKGFNLVRLLNHRRQENVHMSYGAFLNALNQADPENRILLSLCEWGKTQPQQWGWKVAASWRILNDITFMVGSDGNPGRADWASNNTASITSQYNKAVVMDEYAGFHRGWNDPDMMVIGMDGINETMAKTHMSLWCMMNAPLMLGLDLRRVEKGDAIYNIIANPDVIALNQDPLGVPAKRIWCSLTVFAPDTSYITNNRRVDILAKPLADGDVALCFVNLDDKTANGPFAVSAGLIETYIGAKMPPDKSFLRANHAHYAVQDLWTKKTWQVFDGVFSLDEIDPWDSITLRVRPILT